MLSTVYFFFSPSTSSRHFSLRSQLCVIESPMNTMSNSPFDEAISRRFASTLSSHQSNSP